MMFSKFYIYFFSYYLTVWLSANSNTFRLLWQNDSTVSLTLGRYLVFFFYSLTYFSRA